jgi:hypothetical protein
MDPTPLEWQSQMDALWERLDSMAPEAFVRAVDALAAERPANDATALFEKACARDSTGVEDEAEALYRAALAGSLDPYRRTRATIQLASTLRILGNLEQSEALLVTELDRHALLTDPPLDDELRATLALTWIARGRSTEAAALALTALAPHLSRYRRSMLANAAAILERERAR